jgi:hypothetical protein
VDIHSQTVSDESCPSSDSLFLKKTTKGKESRASGHCPSCCWHHPTVRSPCSAAAPPFAPVAMPPEAVVAVAARACSRYQTFQSGAHLPGQCGIYHDGHCVRTCTRSHETHSHGRSLHHQSAPAAMALHCSRRLHLHCGAHLPVQCGSLTSPFSRPHVRTPSRSHVRTFARPHVRTPLRPHALSLAVSASLWPRPGVSFQSMSRTLRRL